jgi:hypothetical protein
MSTSGRPCAHDEVIWDAIQIEYNGEGTADIIQEGNCEQCGEPLRLNYEPQDPVALGSRTPSA